MPTMLVLTNFAGFSGGHLKYLDYIRHMATSGLVEPVIHATEPSRQIPDNPYLSLGLPVVDSLVEADSYFVPIRQWPVLDRAGLDTASRPVINLIQHVEVAAPGDPRRALLARPALRFCVAPEVAAAVTATGNARGAVVPVSNGIDLDHLESLRQPAQAGRVFIAGWKQPDVAQALGRALAPRFDVDVVIQGFDREAFLRRLAQAQICVLLPNRTEGFFLPAIEAMALGVPAVVPDCVGNRSFCLHEHTCLMPDWAVNALAAAVVRLCQDAPLAARLREAGLDMAARHSLAGERRRVHAALRTYLAGFARR